MKHLSKTLTVIFCVFVAHTCSAQSQRVGALTQYADALLPTGEHPSSEYAPICKFPFRSVSGQRFENLTPLFNWLTNRIAPGAVEPRRPMHDWAVLYGDVISINYDRGIIVKREFLTSPSCRSDHFHVINCPGQDKLIDGSQIFCLAKQVGTVQYRTVGGALATVPSFDFGRPPTPEEIAAVRARSPVKFTSTNTTSAFTNLARP